MNKMCDNTLKLLTGMGRSKPFMMVVIVLLFGYIYLHFSATGSQLDASTPTLITPRVHLKPRVKQIRPGSINNDLFNDALDTRDNDDVRLGRKCKKKFDVSFLKVHKAGSTTIMNIFLRFAISNKLNLVLPPHSKGAGFNYLGYGKTVDRKRIIPLPYNETYNILCNHVVYNKTAFRGIMPEDTVYVGILREPNSHFRSAASYYGFYQHLMDYARAHHIRYTNSVISEFLTNKHKFRVSTYFVYNRMSFDFGIPTELFHNDSFVDGYIKELHADYGLVMIMEKFPESLVLLKRVLCWDTKDILYVPLNARHRSDPFTLTDTDAEHLKQWNSADNKLYDHFRLVFEDKLKDAGSDLLEEVESFKKIQGVVKEFCSKETFGAVLKVPKTQWDDSFEVGEEDCDLMTEDELPMMHRLIEQAWTRYRQSTPAGIAR